MRRPTDATQVFGKLGYRTGSSDTSLTAAYAGHGSHRQRPAGPAVSQQGLRSVYTKPDNTQNKSHLLNLVTTNQLGDTVTLAANAFYRKIKTRTLNGDINDGALGENVFYNPATAADRNALIAAGYTNLPTATETLATAPFPFLKCIASIIRTPANGVEPNEKCTGLLNRTATSQHDGGLGAQVTFTLVTVGSG